MVQLKTIRSRDTVRMAKFLSSSRTTNIWQIKLLLNTHVIILFLALTVFKGTAAAEEDKCHNNGTATSSGCVCAEKWTGEHCQDYNCVNGLSVGSNHDLNSTFFTRHCICNIGWSGELCDESTIDKCNGHGKSIKGQCVCEISYIGENCESVDKCINGQFSQGRCSCFYGWTGDFCDAIVCHAGKPDRLTNDTSCICEKNYKGRHCDICLHEKMTPFPECSTGLLRSGSSRRNAKIDFNPLLVGALLCVAFVVLVSIAFFYRQRKQRLFRLQQIRVIEEEEAMI